LSRSLKQAIAQKAAQPPPVDPAVQAKVQSEQMKMQVEQGKAALEMQKMDLEREKLAQQAAAERSRPRNGHDPDGNREDQGQCRDCRGHGSEAHLARFVAG
jgi:hypothetical protein